VRSGPSIPAGEENDMRVARTMTWAVAIGLLCWLGPGGGRAEAAEVVVYSARSSQYGPEAAFDAFTKKTGIQVKIFGGNSSELYERLKAEGDKTPADVLVTVDAGNLWNAARAGLLSRVDSPEIQANIPANLRDPENRWVGLTVRARTIMYNTKKVKPEELTTYEALGDPKWKGRLCLRTSSYIYNQSFVATMIKRHGEAKTEAIVRAWAANQPILINGDTKILEAIAAGQCDVGITNTYYLARILAKDPNFPVAPFFANQETTGTHVNVSGAGVTAHAKNRASAIKLLEFLSSPEAQQMFADGNFEYPANPQASVNRILAKWGTFKQDDINVASAGELQAAATRLADRAGYK
jgi:iron(III) transport system substrate-binding protein